MMSNGIFPPGGPALAGILVSPALKTSALYYLRDNPKVNRANFCASFEQAIVMFLAGKTINAVKNINPKQLLWAEA